jgi:hypothetical protein
VVSQDCGYSIRSVATNIEQFALPYSNTAYVEITIFLHVTLCRVADGYQHFEESTVSIIRVEDLMMDAASYFETTSPIYQIRRRHISQERNLYIHLHVNPKSHKAYSQ